MKLMQCNKPSCSLMSCVHSCLQSLPASRISGSLHLHREIYSWPETHLTTIMRFSATRRNQRFGFASVVSLLLLLLILPSHALALVLHRVVSFMDRILDRGAKEFNDNHPLFQRSPNWRPLSHTQIENDTAIELELVSGCLPSDLNGVALRVGPNADPTTSFNKRLNPIIDGDGMLHSVRLDGENKRALYSAGWFETPRRIFEHKKNNGAAFFLRIGEMKGKTGILKLLLSVLKLKLFGQGQLHLGQANTALFHFGGKHYAMQENSLPFEFKLRPDGSFESVGYQDFGALDSPFGAHPRVDVDTGDIFFCGYDPFNKEAPLKWGMISPENGGTVTRSIAVPTDGCPFSHDFMITKNFVLILDNSARFDFSRIVSGDVIQVNTECPLRIGICHKNATSAEEIIWYVHDDAVVLVHFLHAWEEKDGTIRLWAPIWSEFVSDVVSMKEDPASFVRMAELSFDLNDPQRRIRTEVIDTGTATDFTVVSRDFVGHKATCGFGGIMRRSVIDFDGISKWCMDRGSPLFGLEKTIFHGDGVTGGEPILAPKGSKMSSEAVYVINFLYDSKADETFLVVYDGEDFRRDKVVAKFLMPHRIPHGLHASWVKATEL